MLVCGIESAGGGGDGGGGGGAAAAAALDCLRCTVVISLHQDDIFEFRFRIGADIVKV